MSEQNRAAGLGTPGRRMFRADSPPRLHLPAPYLFSTSARSDREGPVLLDYLAVDLDLAAAAQVADEVRVHGALVDAARLGIAGADRHVDRAADLLVEEDRPGAGGDAEVRPD